MTASSVSGEVLNVSCGGYTLNELIEALEKFSRRPRASVSSPQRWRRFAFPRGHQQKRIEMLGYARRTFRGWTSTSPQSGSLHSLPLCGVPRVPRRRMPAVAASGPPPLQEAGPGPVQAVPRSGLAVALHPVGDHAYGNDSERCSRYRRLTAHDGSTSQHYGGNRSELEVSPGVGNSRRPAGCHHDGSRAAAVRR